MRELHGRASSARALACTEALPPLAPWTRSPTLRHLGRDTFSPAYAREKAGTTDEQAGARHGWSSNEMASGGRRGHLKAPAVLVERADEVTVRQMPWHTSGIPD
ncbi:hypothetical protein GCM10023178_57710 [Actinomadura luteofluorescens]